MRGPFFGLVGKIFIPAIALLLLTVNFSSAEQVARLSVHWSAKHHCAKHAQIFADRVNERAKGKLKIEVYPSKQLFGIREVMGAVTSGAVELGGIVGVVSFPPINKNFYQHQPTNNNNNFFSLLFSLLYSSLFFSLSLSFFSLLLFYFILFFFFYFNY